MKKVGFICVHNSCRSQIAEALAKQFSSHFFECYSAGTEIKDEINQDAVRIMNNMFQINMNKTQYSKMIDDIPDMDIIITMGCNVHCPVLPCKYREDWGIPDPTGQSDEDFMKVIQLIHDKVLNLNNRIDLL